ncbi:MAG TPA: 4a-hydroxytetrahydrobiopterin dehydratase [Streptosporangiaceae bacterium]|nr:4a-hydroxytetrahydrobiopterin dehydratase [Streptosporangiaceae bacterium]
MELLTEEQIAAELADVLGWRRDGGSIVLITKHQDFRGSLLYLNAVGYLAEQAGHHPDAEISWDTVTLTLSTHSAGGLTGKDFALARRISALS